MFCLHVIRRKDFLDGSLYIQPIRVVTGVGFIGHRADIAVDDKLIVVQVTAVCCNAEVVAHILRAQALFPRHQRLVEFLAMSCANDVRARIAE